MGSALSIGRLSRGRCWQSTKRNVVLLSGKPQSLGRDLDPRRDPLWTERVNTALEIHRAELRRGGKLMSDNCGEKGFSYVDVMIAVTILLVGIMAMLSAMTSGIVMTTTSQQQLAAKQYAQSTIEAIFSTRDVRPDILGWDAIGNVGNPSTPGGVFLSGQRAFYPTAGPDGIIGTADDGAGPDGVLGTSDDIEPVAGFLRQITITNIPDPDRPGAPISLRQIDVTISFGIGAGQYREIMTSYVANYRTTN